MVKVSINVLVVLCAFFYFSIWNNAQASQYIPLPGQAGEFSIGYTLGIHQGKVQKISGQFEITDKPFRIKSGFAEVDISDLITDNPKINCHLQEALGIEYEKSEFPDDHVCDGENKIPPTGPNSITYPKIRFVIKRAELVSGNCEAACVQKLSGTWTIHGQTKKTRGMLVKLEKVPEGYRVDFTQEFRLTDYGVIVKSFLFVSVDEAAKVHMNVILEKE